MNTTPTSHKLATLWPHIENVRIGMLTTVDHNGHLISRPMTSQRTGTDGSIWFFTSDESQVSQNISVQPSVNVSFVDAGNSLYVSVSGHAERVMDQARIREMWNPLVAAWFPQGVEDPHLALIRVMVESAEYWDSERSRMVQLLDMARAAVTGRPPQVKPSEHGRINPG